MARPPLTPDGHYIVVRGVLWRATNPELPEAERQRWVDALMDARRAVKRARAAKDPRATGEARERVHAAKVALGERGPPWWDEGPVVDRMKVENTPYAQWWSGRGDADES